MTFSPARQCHFAPDRLRVLVVDDEPLLRATYRRILRDYYEIEVAGSGAEVLEFGRAIIEFDAILCDYMLQDMNGLCLLDQLQASDPHVAQRLVFCTGGCDDETLEAIASRGITILEKPCTCSELLAAVGRRVANSRRDRPESIAAATSADYLFPI